MFTVLYLSKVIKLYQFVSHKENENYFVYILFMHNTLIQEKNCRLLLLGSWEMQHRVGKFMCYQGSIKCTSLHLFIVRLPLTKTFVRLHNKPVPFLVIGSV